MTLQNMLVLPLLGAMVLGTACTTDLADEAPSPTDDAALDTAAWVYSTNADGTWGAKAGAPVNNLYGNQVRGAATFTGPSGKTRKMGACILRQGLLNDAVVPCAGGTQAQVDAQCAGLNVGTGGNRYCTQADGSGSGQKYCFVRPGTQTQYCGGSPALSGQAIAPGTVTTPWVGTTTNSYWLTYACFEGCSATDPSSSSAMMTEYNLGWCETHNWPPQCPAPSEP